MFRVGVVGHRPNRLVEAELTKLAKILYGILQAVEDGVSTFFKSPQKLYDAAVTPKLVAVSSCAEGSDRIFADQAIKLKYALHCPMPFAQAEYERDFESPKALEQDSLTKFRTLLDKAKAGPDFRAFELDGKGTDKAADYGQAGGVVLNQSDILVAVWDGADAAGAGGTVGTMEAAIFYQIPVICVDARDPHAWQILRKSSDLEQLRECGLVQSHGDTVGALVNEILDVPRSTRHDGQLQKKSLVRIWQLFLEVVGLDSQRKNQDQKATDYFDERMPNKNPAMMLWKFFRNVIGDNQFMVSPLRREPIGTIEGGKYAATELGGRGWANETLGHHFAWADRLADHYADCYRSSFLFSFLGGAVAVFLAILPVWVGWNPQQHPIWLLLTAAFEFLLLLSIIGLIRWGTRRRWHERWMEYRLLAELIREIHFLIPLGGGRPMTRPFSHLGGYGRPMETWMSWHARAVERATGLASARIDGTYVLATLKRLKDVVDGQVAFHRRCYDHHHRIEHRLHRWGGLLFVVTAAVVALHLSILLVEIQTDDGSAHSGMGLMTVMAAFFPVAGAALAGIKHQGAFARLAMRNEAMVEGMTQYGQTINVLMKRKVPPTSAEAVKLAVSVAQLMIDEVVDWRVSALVRPLVPPA